MADRLTERGLDPAIRIRVLEALKTLSDALEQAGPNYPAATAGGLREAADDAMRAVARVMLEIHVH
jgi:hypothetical protein